MKYATSSKTSEWLKQACAHFTMDTMREYVIDCANVRELILLADKDPAVKRMAREIRRECGDIKLIKLKTQVLRTHYGSRAFTHYILAKTADDLSLLYAFACKQDPIAGEELAMIFGHPLLRLQMAVEIAYAYMLACNMATKEC